MIKLKTALLAASAAAMLIAFPAHAAVVDFTGEAPGAKPNGYAVGGITFNDTQGANLTVNDFGGQSIGQGLSAGNDDTSALEMLFGSPSINLSLIFGNDDPGYASPGDLALLRIFSGATQVGQTTVVMNLDDLANQTIGISGIAFDRATFVYANSSLNPINLIEVVDNITYSGFAGGAVPEPSIWAMMLVGFGFAGAAMRRRQRAVFRHA